MENNLVTSIDRYCNNFASNFHLKDNNIKYFWHLLGVHWSFSIYTILKIIWSKWRPFCIVVTNTGLFSVAWKPPCGLKNVNYNTQFLAYVTLTLPFVIFWMWDISDKSIYIDNDATVNCTSILVSIMCSLLIRQLFCIIFICFWQEDIFLNYTFMTL